MDISKYEELRGIIVEDSDKPLITAQIRRTKTILESMLGYSLDKKKAGINQYEEKGKVTTDCIFNGPVIFWEIDDLHLSAPDEVEGSYRIFPYNQNDQYFAVDPYTTLYKVKLVFIKAGEEPNGVTHKTFKDSKIGVYRSGSIAKYIERYRDWCCTCSCDISAQLAVDADWLNEECLPDSLLYIWSDMVEYYSDEKRNVKSETLSTHSYTKETVPKPEELPESIKIITKYAGPHGSVNNIVTI